MLWLLRSAVALALLAVCSCALPATYHVARNAPGASDENPGTEGAPLKSIGAAMQRVQPGDTVLVGEGVYREEVACPLEDWKDPQVRCTLAAEAGARPVVDGADPVPGPWERAEVKLPDPPAGAPAIYACAWEPYSTMVFADGEPLAQIGLQASPARAKGTNGFQFKKQWDGKSVEDMRPGSFLCDGDAKRLYVWLADGSDPKAHAIEASVRDDGVTLRGTWTLGGLEVRHVMDGFWPHEQAVAVVGPSCIVEDCRILHNDVLGLILAGEDGLARNNLIAYNGLMGMTSNVGYRTLVEGNEFHHNAWRGDVVCLTAGNKFVCWRDSKFLRNYWHDEPASALWLDISDVNILIAENRFDNCSVGVYWEISRWAVIANNVFRNCGRGIWVYSSDTLIAHNVLDGCGEGITITGFPRHATYSQSVFEPSRDCLMAVRNNLAVNNLLIDCPGAYISITKGAPFGWGNWSDYNAFVWTLPPYHRTGLHLNFLEGWDTLYSRLPTWRMARHCDTHSVVVDPNLYNEVQSGNPYVGLAKDQVLADARIVNRAAWDYHLAEDSPLRGRGVAIPAELDSPYSPRPGTEIVSRAWEKTFLQDAPDANAARAVYKLGEQEHYRLQPLPKLHRLVDLDAAAPGTPGLNPSWREPGDYPHFVVGEADTAEAGDWVLAPDNLLGDPSFEQAFSKPDGEATSPWISAGLHAYQGMACANLAPSQRANVIAYQKLGPIRAGCEYLLCGDMTVQSIMEGFAAVGEMYLAAGDPTQRVGEAVSVSVAPRTGGSWNTYQTYWRAAPDDGSVGKELFVVIGGRVEGPDSTATDAAGFVRWDELWVLASP